MEQLSLSETDSSYHQSHYKLSERSHHYGDRVHILGDPFSLTQLAKLCHPDTVQPQVNQLIGQLYYHLLGGVINTELPCHLVQWPTRMIEHTPKGVFAGQIFDNASKVVCVDIARAGIVPSQVCYDLLNTLLEPANLRQDHLFMAREVGEDGSITGAKIMGDKIGGPIDDCYVFFPDPMGATGTSLVAAMDHYIQNHGTPRAFVTLNLIITPHFIHSLLKSHPQVKIYALRLDRGMSPPEILKLAPGEKWEEENGLTSSDYIVPGGGGFGEVMNNSFV